MRNWNIIVLVTLVIGSCFISCEKDAGEGGTSMIKGKILGYEYCCEQWRLASDTFPMQAEDVYIIYGDNDFYGDKVETHFDGTYQFPYLQKGKYTVYTYSDDTNFAKQPGEKMIIKKEIEINNHEQTVSLPDMVVYIDD